MMCVRLKNGAKVQKNLHMCKKLRKFARFFYKL